MAKVATFKGDKRRKEFLSLFEDNFAAAAEHLFGLTLSPSKRRFFHSVCQMKNGLIVDNKLGSIADTTALQSAMLYLLLRPDAVVNVVFASGGGVTDGSVAKTLSSLVRRVTRKEPWLIEYFGYGSPSSLVIGDKRCAFGALNTVFVSEGNAEKLAGHGDVIWILPRAGSIDDKALSMMNAGRVMAFYEDRAQIGRSSIRANNEPVDLVSLDYERATAF